jgi:hypothetical protein
MPSIDPHLISNVEELLEKGNNYNKRCILEGLETEYGIISLLDLELTRMLHPNGSLKIPSPRSQPFNGSPYLGNSQGFPTSPLQFVPSAIQGPILYKKTPRAI